jgi:hypothetical protein
MKKRKVVVSLIKVLPNEILLEIFKYLKVKHIIYCVSPLSKEIHSMVSSKDFLITLLKENGLFEPILKSETTLSYFSSLPSFHHFIFHPMKMIQTYTLKLKEIHPKRFTNSSKDFNVESLKNILNQKLNQNIELPPEYQMFISMCEKWGNESNFFIKGNKIFQSIEFLSDECQCKTKEIQIDIPTQYIKVGKIREFGCSTSFYLSLDSNESFGKIMGIFHEEGFLGISEKSFVQMIQGIGEFMERMKDPNNPKWEEDFNDSVEWYHYVNRIGFEYESGPIDLGESEASESEESN